MSTFNLPNTNIPVKLVGNLTENQLLEFPAFKNWLHTLQHNLSLQQTIPSHEFHASPYTLRSIDVQSIDRWGSRLGFVKLIAEVKNAQSESLPGSVFLRGASVAMLIILQPDDIDPQSQKDKHVLLTFQPRIAGGSLKFVELPAGMVDNGTFQGAAAKEIKEELGLEIAEDELKNLTELAIPETKEIDKGSEERLQRALYPSVGGCDEYIPIFLHEKRVPREQLRKWEGKLTGLREEGEKITLKLVKLEDLWKEGARDAKALAAWALYEGLKRTGSLGIPPI